MPSQRNTVSFSENKPLLRVLFLNLIIGNLLTYGFLAKEPSFSFVLLSHLLLSIIAVVLLIYLSRLFVHYPFWGTRLSLSLIFACLIPTLYYTLLGFWVEWGANNWAQPLQVIQQRFIHPLSRMPIDFLTSAYLNLLTLWPLWLPFGIINFLILKKLPSEEEKLKTQTEVR